MHFPVEYTGSRTDFLTLKECKTFWKTHFQHEFSNNKDAISVISLYLSHFHERISIHNVDHRNIFLGWRWRKHTIHKDYQACIDALVACFETHLNYTKFTHTYKNFTNMCIDYHYMLLLILQKSNHLIVNYTIFNLFRNQPNKQQSRINGEWQLTLSNHTNISETLLSLMDYTHLGLGFAALYVFHHEKLIPSHVIYALFDTLCLILCKQPSPVTW